MLKVFYLNISDPDFARLVADDFCSWMDPAKFLSVSAYKNSKVRREKFLGEWLVRSLLLRFFHLQPGDYSLEKGKHGKPCLGGTAIPAFFNLSHSGDYIVCAISEREVGVDIEKIGNARLAVAKRFFHPEEIRKLDGEPIECRDDLFFTYWSVKESFLKYIGTGLTCPLSSFWVVTDESNDIKISSENGIGTPYIYPCKIDPQYKCFVCSEGREKPEVIHITEWTDLNKEKGWCQK